jgi:hypothetical protein
VVKGEKMKPSSTRQSTLPILVLVLFVVFVIQVTSSQAVEVAKGQTSTTPPVASNPSPEVIHCREGSGWMWTYGPTQPVSAGQVQQTLSSIGIEAVVKTRSFGEADSCGNFSLVAIDFSLTVNHPQFATSTERQELVEKIHPILAEYGNPSLGNIQITFLPSKTVFNIRPGTAPADYIESKNLGSIITSTQQVFLPITTHSYIRPDEIIKRVFIIVYDPILGNGQTLSDYLYWAEHSDMTQAAVDLFHEASHGELHYTIADTIVLTDGWPVKMDGFQYTEAEYLAVISGQTPAHSPDNVDYNKIVNDPRLDICGRANRYEIDEVWIYNGPYFGFWESTLVGPGAYWYNSPPVPGPYTCNRLIPIMGPSPERPDMAGHGEGHRMESTMTQAYGSWQQNQTNHNWERFALVKALSPDYTYSGCGNIHYPPNGTSGYDYGNQAIVNSNCDDFENYPNLSDPAITVKPVSCSTWGCNHYDYMMYWFGHLPDKPGCGADQVANDWWKYFADPALALNPMSACR